MSNGSQDGPGQGADPTDPRGRPSVPHHDAGGDGPADLGRLARDLERQSDPDTTLQRVVEWAVQVVPGARHAVVGLVQRRRDATSAAASDDLGRRFDALQQEVGEGPGLDAMHEHRTVRVDDLAREQRWPELARRWSDVGVRSALSLQLFVHRQDLGSLTVLSGQTSAFDDESERWGLLVASHAAVAVSGALRVEGLTRANANRTVIGQAEGILMERLKVSPEVAFAMLARISQETNRKLFRVAEDLVKTGEITMGDGY